MAVGTAVLSGEYFKTLTNTYLHIVLNAHPTEPIKRDDAANYL